MVDAVAAGVVAASIVTVSSQAPVTLAGVEPYIDGKDNESGTNLEQKLEH